MKISKWSETFADNEYGRTPAIIWNSSNLFVVVRNHKHEIVWISFWHWLNNGSPIDSSSHYIFHWIGRRLQNSNIKWTRKIQTQRRYCDYIQNHTNGIECKSPASMHTIEPNDSKMKRNMIQGSVLMRTKWLWLCN